MVYCMAPFVHSYFMSGETTERVCCVANPHSDTIDTDLKVRWKNKNYQTIRKRMMSDTPDDTIKNICSNCINIENSGEESDRQRFNRMYSDIDVNVVTGNQFGSPIDLDLRPSNLCNLQCRMCWSGSSSQIEKEIQKSNNRIYFMGPENVTNHELTNTSIDFILENIQHSKRIKFLGGEPTIMPEIHTMLDLLIDKNLTNIPIHFTTNLTNTNSSFIKKLQQFSNISFNYSIDGTDKTLEYIRYPVKWKSIQNNIEKYKDIATHSNITFTLQAYNLHNLKEFIDWSESIGVTMRINLVGQEHWDSVLALPKSYRDAYLKNINTNITNNLLHNSKECSIIEFIRHTKILDNNRNQHIKNYIPEIWELIKEDYDAIQI